MKRFVMSTLQPLGDAPEVFDILPLGQVHSTKGDFVVDAESFEAMKQAMEGKGVDIVVDYEHQTLYGQEAPAAGWIRELLLTDHSIAAKVDWTERASDRIRQREYRYCSPVVMARKSDNKAVLLHSVALTNTPAIEGQFPIACKDEEDNIMDILKKLAELLGLDNAAGEEEIMEALKARLEAPPPAEPVVCKKVAGLLEVPEDADAATVSAKIMALKNPANYVPAADFLALKAQLEQRQSAELVEKALAEGKITPAQKEWAAAYVLKDKEGFEKFVSLAPASVPMGRTDVPPKARGAGDADSLLVCKNLGLTPEELKQYGGAEEE